MLNTISTMPILRAEFELPCFMIRDKKIMGTLILNLNKINSIGNIMVKTFQGDNSSGDKYARNYSPTLLPANFTFNKIPFNFKEDILDIKIAYMVIQAIYEYYYDGQVKIDEQSVSVILIILHKLTGIQNILTYTGMFSNTTIVQNNINEEKTNSDDEWEDIESSDDDAEAKKDSNES
jgi:hypothetical protein